MSDYVELTTTDNTEVTVLKNSISVIEEITGTARTDAYLKLYIAGYSFSVKMDKDDLLKKIKED